MLIDQENVHDTNKFQVVSVESTERPVGMTTGKWFRYVIGRGLSRIEGFKPGTLQGVTKHANSVALDLNERMNSSGSTYAPRGRRKRR